MIIGHGSPDSQWVLKGVGCVEVTTYQYYSQHVIALPPDRCVQDHLEASSAAWLVLVNDLYRHMKLLPTASRLTSWRQGLAAWKVG